MAYDWSKDSLLLWNISEGLDWIHLAWERILWQILEPLGSINSGVFLD
jgi:hypothetical protein